MKIALVHDYLLEAGGAERVLRVLADMYPEAPIYTALTKHGTARKLFSDRQIFESPWGWFLKIGRLYSYFRFLLPWVWQSVDLRHYDLVVTSCSGYIARGFRVGPKTKVIAYCHTPPRWLYGYDTPTGAQKRWWGQTFMWIVGPFVRYFDYQSAQRVDVWIANSQEVAKRIEKFYRKKAIVVYPPVELSPRSSDHSPTVAQGSELKSQDYYLIVSRVVGGKGIMEAVTAFKELKIPLKIVGEIVHQKLGRDIECVGRVSDEALVALYSHAKGFVALARDEDFGMTVVESMLRGTPVLAFNGGGYKETVIDGKTGILIEGVTVADIEDGILKFETTKWDRVAIKKWASQFGRARFEKEIRKIVGA